MPHIRALAQFLADLALVHRPRRVYGNRLPPEALAIAALQLALHGFGAPPVACEESFLRLQELLAPVPEQELRSLVADVYRLWLRVPADSPIACRWRARGCQMPKAPSQEDLPALLQECCFFQTPQKRPLEPKDHSATPGSFSPQDPCAIKMRPNPGTPRSEESTSPGSWQSESGDMTASSEMEQERGRAHLFLRRLSSPRMSSLVRWIRSHLWRAQPFLRRLSSPRMSSLVRWIRSHLWRAHPFLRRLSSSRTSSALRSSHRRRWSSSRTWQRQHQRLWSQRKRPRCRSKKMRPLAPPPRPGPRQRLLLDPSRGTRWCLSHDGSIL
ncbi:unnamed protein product [Effrenium voratum]|uniref:Uncharacterized protein n=1 Tax=Effrenium voratum TaxID=2562239 RepID=A0AA36ND43_9DINO|nr:unnamed protein product [Effrenium voratum]